jgi:hypothetical protein
LFLPEESYDSAAAAREGRAAGHTSSVRCRGSQIPGHPGPVYTAIAYQTSDFLYNAFMPTIRVTVVSPSPGFYNIQFADANDTSINKGYHGIPETRLTHELEKLSSVSAAEITAKLQGAFPIQKFIPVDEATYQSLFAE